MARTQHLFGFHAVTSRLRTRPESIREIYVARDRQDGRMRDLLKAAEAARRKVFPVPADRLEGMAGGGRHQGVVAVVEAVQLPQFIDDVLEGLTGAPLLLVLDGVQDPHNLGACLRVADAAGAHAVIAPKDRSVGLNATVAKVASGAAETVPYITVTNLARTLRELKERNIWIIGADEGGDRHLYQTALSGPVAWVMGAEGEGLRRLTRENCDEIVSIPMAGGVESLNVSVASGICLYEARRQRLAASP